MRSGHGVGRLLWYAEICSLGGALARLTGTPRLVEHRSCAMCRRLSCEARPGVGRARIESQLQFVGAFGCVQGVRPLNVCLLFADGAPFHM